MFAQARFNSNIVVDVGNESGSPAYASMSFDATQVELYRLLNLLVMVTLMDSEKIIYRCLPSTPELLELLTLPKTITRLDRWIRLLMGVIIGAAVAIVGCVVLIKLAWSPQPEIGLAGFLFMGLAALAWVILVVIDLVQSIGSIVQPARELAGQFDRDLAIESRLLTRFQAIPEAVLLARHQRLESQLQVWEKWLDTTRLMGLLGPPFIFFAKGTFGDLLPSTGPWNIEVMVAALLTGVLLGAISFRSGMKRLHRLAWLLKRSADLRHTLLLGRRQRGKKP